MRKFMMMLFVLLPVFLLAQDAQIDLLKSDIRAKKLAIITEVMDFNEEQANKFWPVYREYNTAREKIADEWLNLIKQYLKFYENMTDPTAKVLWKKSMDIEQKRLDLEKKYYKKFEKALTPKMAVKLMQLESQIHSLIRLQVDAQLPLLE
jgi:hypothetical protein